jgi:hypothetical protein
MPAFTLAQRWHNASLESQHKGQHSTHYNGTRATRMSELYPMTQDEQQPTAPTVGADETIAAELDTRLETFRATWRDRRFLGQTTIDLIQVVIIFAIGLAVPWWLLQQAQRLSPAQQPIAQWLAVAFGTFAGAILVYTIQRRPINDLIITSRWLAHTGREALAITRYLTGAVSAWMDQAYTVGQQEALAAATAEAAVRIAELETEIATSRRYAPPGFDSHGLDARLEALQAAIATLQTHNLDRDEQVSELAGGIAEVHAQADALAAAITRQEQRRPMKIDAMDDWILVLLSKTPQPTDEEISKIVNLSTSQVLRRRNILAAAGYAAAQKRQGQRPSPR